MIKYMLKIMETIWQLREWIKTLKVIYLLYNHTLNTIKKQINHLKL